MTKRYKLLKDLPNLKKGAIFQKSNSGNTYFYAIPISQDKPEYDQVGIVEFEALDVEQNKCWFQEIKEPERIKVESMYDLNNVYQPQCVRTGFETSAPIPEDKFKAIRQAIENVLNETEIDILQREKFFKELQTWGRETPKWVESFVKRMPSSEPLYTQEQMDEAIKASFEAAKRVTDKKIGTIKYYSGGNWFVYEEKYPDIQDYLSSLKK